MRKFLALLLLALLAFFSHSFAQTATIGIEDFEAASPNWLLNTTDLGCAVGADNKFIINNLYTGGTFYYGFITVPDTPDQPAAVTGSPRSRYLHINAIMAYNAGIYNANYLAWFSTERHFAKMNYDWNTTGKSGVSLSFYWLGRGGAGYLYYSTNSEQHGL